ncbi:hypothetical protein KM295_02355 [Natronomonas sp. F2-12]|uniref:Uncharacterized protein n=1 Tax=Natronomonas aquatica TaxID=2841590 RepID=A0A9R1D5X2_9EURY|nr:hypothetical protein [Natronomonas aquatica]MCQ4332347.1 hypothetical protein [Natronomonas aquatica]
MIRRSTLVVTVLFVVGGISAGIAAPVAAQGSGDAFGTNVSTSSEFESEATEFENAAGRIENASGSLRETAVAIENSSSYTDEHHGSANESLSEMEQGLDNLRDAESEAASELRSDDLSPAERFLVRQEMSEERNETVTTAENSLSEYENAVSTQRVDARSTVLMYFGGALVAGLLGGALLGAAVPLMEAKNVRDQMKLSRDVSYNRRAGLVPAVAGIVLLLGAIGLLWYLGAIDLIRVMV